MAPGDETVLATFVHWQVPLLHPLSQTRLHVPQWFESERLASQPSFTSPLQLAHAPEHVILHAPASHLP